MFLKSNSIFHISTPGFLIYNLFWLCIIVYRVIIRWRTFVKAGKNGWEALIPIYSSWTLFEISGYPGYLILFGLIPYAGIIVVFVFKILAAISLAKKFGKEDGFCLLMIFLPIIGYSILAWDSKVKYDDTKGNQNDSFPTRTTKPTNEDEDFEEFKYCTYCGKKNEIDANYCAKCSKDFK